jgi:hypothetical protein
VLMSGARKYKSFSAAIPNLGLRAPNHADRNAEHDLSDSCSPTSFPGARMSGILQHETPDPIHASS